MAVTKKARRYILRHYPASSIKELATELGLKPREVREVIDTFGREIEEEKPARPVLGFARVNPLGIALLIAVVSVVYLNSIRNGFHYDDIHSLLQNLGVRVEWTKNPESRKLFLRYFTEPQLFSSRPNVGMPRPLLMNTFGFNYMWTKYEPWSWVLVNFLLHLANTILIYVALSHLSGRPRIALLTALLFGVHPINTETVNYINCRSESLTTLFMLFTMYFFTRSMREDKRLGLRILCFLFFGLGLLTKELMFVTPGLLVAIDLIFLNPIKNQRIPVLKRALEWYLPIILLWVVYFFYRKQVMPEKAAMAKRKLSGLNGIMQSLIGADPVRDVMDNVISQTGIVVTYIRLLFYPVHLNISYENLERLITTRQFIKDPLINGTILCIILLVGLVALAIYWHRKHPAISFSIALFFITLSITSSVIPLNAVMNEHRLYLPSFAACLLIVGLLDRVAAYLAERSGEEGSGWPMPVQAACLVIILCFCALTMNRNFTWHTDLSVWRDSVTKSPLKAQVVSDLGNAYYRGGRALTKRGKIGNDGKISKKERMIIKKTFYKDVDVGPINPQTRKVLDDLYMQGLNRGEQLYQWAIRAERNYYKAWHNLGTINYTYASIELKKDTEKGKEYLHKAIKYFDGALRIYKNGESNNDMASCEMQLARHEKDPDKKKELLKQAEKHYQLALLYNPELYKAYVNLAMIKNSLGKTIEAIPLTDKAIRINPMDPSLYFNKAKYLDKLKMYDQAMTTLNRCLEISPGHSGCKRARQRIQKKMNGAGP